MDVKDKKNKLVVTAIANPEGWLGPVDIGVVNSVAYYNSEQTVAPAENANSGILVTDSEGVPSVSTTAPDGLNLGQPAAIDLLNASNIQNSATTATSDAIADSIVLRDSLGNFSAATITSNLEGHASQDAFLISSPTPNDLVFTDEFGQSFDSQIAVTSSSSFDNATNNLIPTALAIKTYVDNKVSSTFQIQGNWDAQTNTPVLQAGVGSLNYAYIVTVPGVQTLPSGVLTEYFVGDLLYYGADNIWNQVSQGQAVVSINGLTGVVANFGTSNLANVVESNLQNAQVLIYNSALSEYRNESLSKAITIDQLGVATAGDLSGGTGDLSGASIVSESVAGDIIVAGANGLAQDSGVSIINNFDIINNSKVPTTAAVVGYLTDNEIAMPDNYTAASTFLGPVKSLALAGGANSTSGYYININGNDFYFSCNAGPSPSNYSISGNTVSVYKVQNESLVFVQTLTCGLLPVNVVNYVYNNQNYLFVANQEGGSFSVFLFNGVTFDFSRSIKSPSMPTGLSVFNFNNIEYLVASFFGTSQTVVYTFNGTNLTQIAIASTPNGGLNNYFALNNLIYIGVLNKGASFYTLVFNGTSLNSVGSAITNNLFNPSCFEFYSINGVPCLAISNTTTFETNNRAISTFVFDSELNSFVFDQYLEVLNAQEYANVIYYALKAITINGSVYLTGTTVYYSNQLFCFVNDGSKWSKLGGIPSIGFQQTFSVNLVNQNSKITLITSGGAFVYYAPFNNYSKLIAQSLNTQLMSPQNNLVNNTFFNCYPLTQVQIITDNINSYALPTNVSLDNYYVQSISGNVVLNNEIRKSQTITSSATPISLNFMSPARTKIIGSTAQTVTLNASAIYNSANTGFDNTGLTLTVINSTTANVTVNAFDSSALQVMYPGTICTFTIIDQSVNTVNSWEVTYSPLKITNRLASSAVTAAFGSSLTVGTPIQNNLGYTISVNVGVSYSASGAGGQILLGVGPTSTPTTNAVTPVLKTTATFNSFNVTLRQGQYLLLNTNGTMTVSNVTLQAMQV